MATLVRIEHTENTEYTLGELTTIGSNPDCTICLSDVLISGCHAEISRGTGGYLLSYLGTTHGIFVNGEPVTRARLADGDVITIGFSRFRFDDPASRAEEPPGLEFEDTDPSVRMRGDSSADISHGEPSTPKRPAYEKLWAAYRFTREVGLEPNIETLLEHVVDVIFAVFSPDRVVVLLIEPETKQLIPRKVRPLTDDRRTRLSREILDEALSTRQTLMSDDATRDQRFDRSRSVIREGIRSVICAPMIYGDELYGVIHLDSRQIVGVFDRNDVELITTFARHTALAIKNANMQASLFGMNEQLRHANEQAEAANRELRQTNTELQKLVVRDPLTSLYNHTYLQERLDGELRRSTRHLLNCSLIMLDVDRFRELNAELGHAAGDQILRLVAELLRSQCRVEDTGARTEDDAGGAVATRFGGDRFALVLPETRKRNAAALAERAGSHVESLGLSSLGVAGLTISAGIAAFPDDADSAAGLVDAARTALRVAKRTGANQAVAYSDLFAAEDDETGHTDLALNRLLALDRTIANRALRYVYQPIVHTRDRSIYGYEALCRPADPMFPGPDVLLATAERTGRIRALGAVMRELGCRSLGNLAEPMALFVNVHPLEINEELVGWGQRWHRWSSRIVIEVTESAEVSDYRMARETLGQMKGLGFRVAIDDLGSGYAGLNSLARLEPDFAKLDMAMLRGIRSDSRSARLVRYLLDYANDEQMQVIAEGIEDAQEYAVVRDLGCHLSQGYYFAKPAPPFCDVSPL